MLKIPFEAQELGNRFRMQVPNPDDYKVGQSYAAQAVDPTYPVRATIEAKHGNEIAGTFVRT
jgi:hypothetical protein